jgi:hypothetical protein
MRIDIDGELVERYIPELARFGGHGTTDIWRPAYPPEWIAAADQYAA